ncbi:hypothetical protein FRACYDRAFT_249272 [Fragilariopsis cylindrus CCMP1102]|uniref:DUF6824 domain-containing protein n=1 Tax=Fragilariopsis cylindrus CCMP1102 TaxID=635003 RepID=A0A1E7EST4_9STRA|nr:hypothetical protein FRACYDRAFT_249272 [Fragilariopsis cylindrus CCMP1102]|eukprot:OEU08929.1 hypothetical protein FRACYDRAFT_249272 [Fragilariopsis cylindrus CCMP1102]
MTFENKLFVPTATQFNPRRFCRTEGCNRTVKSQGLCQRHGAKPRTCKVEGCDKQAQGNFDKMCTHAGNVQFRDTIHSKKKEYLAPSTERLEKAHITAGIVNDIRTMDPPGRFLKEDKGTKLWFDIGDTKAIKKTSQALREDAPDIRPEIGGTGSYDSLDDSMIPMNTKNGDTTKSKSLSPRGSRRGNAITGPQQNLNPVWPPRQEGNNNNNIQRPHPDYQAQTSMPPPFMPQRGNNNININNNINYAISHPTQQLQQQQPTQQHQQQHQQQQHEHQHQQVFETHNIPIQVPSSLANHPSSSFSNQIFSGAQSVSNKVASASRKAMEALSQAGSTTTNQQYAPYGYGSRPSGRSRKEVNTDTSFDTEYTSLNTSLNSSMDIEEWN